MWNLLIFLALSSLGKVIPSQLIYKCDPNSSTILEMLEERFEELNDPIRNLIKKIPLRSKIPPESLTADSPKQSFTCPTSKQFARNCAEIYYLKRRSGIYAVQPINSSKPFFVYCDYDSLGGGWTVIQNRFNGSTNFFREWILYKIGFGNLNGEFWIGLDKLHALTVDKPQELLVMMTDFKGNRGTAMYKAFAIGNETEKYNLKILGTYYHGNAGDALRYHLGQPFATKDNDNSNYCASTYRGAWWYNNCSKSNLNGLYLKEGRKGVGISWLHWRENIKETKMMIRPGK